MNDNEIRALISEARVTHSKPGGNADAYRLALIADGLMVRLGRRSEDWYASNRRIHELEAEVERLTDDSERLHAAKEWIEDAAFTDDAGDRLVYADQMLGVLNGEHGKES